MEETGSSAMSADTPTIDHEPNNRHVFESGSSTRQRKRTLSKYGINASPPTDDAITYPSDDTYSFLSKGRDYESAYTNHKYTKQEREILATFESMDYLPAHSDAYCQWVKRQPRRLDWDRWIVMGLIGFSVGLIGFLLHQTIQLISKYKLMFSNYYFEKQQISIGYVVLLFYGLAFALISSLTVVLLRPSAAGSGIPELIGFLNGTVVRHIFNIKTMVVKFISCCCSVGSGLPVGPEGPMIHLGSLVGAGVSQFKSDTLKIKLPIFERFRNPEDRRNFVSAGAAAGIASAFGAPVGGLLFSMEEVSSFWNMKLSWQIFFCSMISTATTDLFNSAFDGFKFEGNFGEFVVEKYILFQVTEGLSVNILVFFPTLVIGALGGLLGAAFTFINLRISRTRKRILAAITSSLGRKVIRIFEPCLILVIYTTISTFLPTLFPCREVSCKFLPPDPSSSSDSSRYCESLEGGRWHLESTVEHFTCISPSNSNQSNHSVNPGERVRNITYSEVATLLLVNGEEAIHHLFSRKTHDQFGFASLGAIFPIYFLLSCWCAGTSISSGLVVPMLLIGGLYGRLVGLATVRMFQITSSTPHVAWIDPGAFALIGAASFFGGVSRLTMSLTVIMIEITNDVKFLLPIMVGIMVAKLVGDFFTHPLYHALLELKCIPFLDTEPVVCNENHEALNMELYQARHVMTPDPYTLEVMESVKSIASLLLETPHGGFPIVTKDPSSLEYVFFGLITRLELTVLLKHEDLFEERTQKPEMDQIIGGGSYSTTDRDGRGVNGQIGHDHDHHRHNLGDSISSAPELNPIDYQMLIVDKLEDPASVTALLQKFENDPSYANKYLNLLPYINRSAMTIRYNFSLHRTYIIFRSLGLRHLTVVDYQGHVKGIITRKNLLGFQLEEKISELIKTEMSLISA